MTALCLRQTPLPSGQDFIRRFLSHAWTLPTQDANDELFEGLQIERYALQEAEADLRGVGSFAPDWDGAGSPAPSQATISNASANLPELYRASYASGVDWRSPHISANEDGEVSFEWWCGSRKLTLYFGDQSMQVIKVWGVHVFDDMDGFPLTHAADFAPLWTWLHGD